MGAWLVGGVASDEGMSIEVGDDVEVASGERG